MQGLIRLAAVLPVFCRGTAVGKENIQGEDQKKLDVIANELFINMLKSSFEVGLEWPKSTQGNCVSATGGRHGFGRK